ncbi:MAG: ADP-ribosylation factor 1 [Linnemannia gamsii]|nr:MAG: ADP-ribosylation factor 1 [Linnemannia gamsii]
MLKSTSTWFSAVGKSLVKLVGPKQCRVLLVGAPAGGKTTALYRLKLNETVTTIPTYGINVEVLNTIEGVEFTVWGFGGSRHSQGLLWHHYVAGTDGLIFVVDSSADEPQIAEARDRLWRLYEEYSELLQGSVLLVLANKQDRRDAMSVAEVKDSLELETRAEGRRWHIQGTVAITGEGLMEGMAWLATHLKKAS